MHFQISHMIMDKEEDILSHKYATAILIYLFDHGISKKTDLEKVSTMHTIDKLLPLLEKSSLISVIEKRIGRRVYDIQLTDKGKMLAESLKKAQQEVSNTYKLPTNYDGQFKNLSVNTNILDNHVAIEEHNFDGKGNDRVVYVYVKPNGNNILRLWCEVDNTYDCVHTRYAWSLPDVQAMIQNQVLKGNLKKVDPDRNKA